MCLPAACLRLVAALAPMLVLSGCAQQDAAPAVQFPPPIEFAPDHEYTLDELVQLAIHRNAQLDVARYEAEAAQGLVDQVKALWLPSLRYDFAAIAYDNDLSYPARAFDLVTINVPISGAYNLTHSLALAQILSTGGKRTSGLKQAKYFTAIKKLDVMRQQDAITFDVATYYHLVCLTNDIDAVLEDALRRVRVYRQVAAELHNRGSLRANSLDAMQADFLAANLEQFQIAIRAGRQQAWSALKQAAGLYRDEPLVLKAASLSPAVTGKQVLSAYGEVVKGFFGRPESRMVDLFTRIRSEQTKFAKAQYAPNVLFLGNWINIQGNGNTILGAIDGLIATLIIDVPIYDPVRRGRLREALGLEQASLAFQKQVEQLITLEIEVTAIEAQKALATVFRAARARQVAQDHYEASRQAYSRELIPASGVVTAILFDALGRIGYIQALFNYQNTHARLKRVTADREAQYGY